MSVFLVACNDELKNNQEIIVNDGKEEIHIIPKKFMEECGDLVDLKSGSFKEVADYAVNTSIEYYDCKNKHRILKEFIETSLNKKK